jgi:WD40 repeat protein
MRVLYVVHLDISPDGTKVLAAAGNEVQIWEVRPPAGPLPDWVPSLAEAVGGLRVSEVGPLVPTPPDRLKALQVQLSGSTSDDYWARVGRWFFADPAKRSISPQSDLTAAAVQVPVPALAVAPSVTTPQVPVATPSPNSVPEPSVANPPAIATTSVPAASQPPLSNEERAAQERVSSREVNQAVSLLAGNNPKDALAHLARALRDDPNNVAARTLIFTTLMSQQGWPLSAGPPLRHSAPVTFMSYNGDGSRFVTVCTSLKGSSTVQVWDAKTFASVGDAIHPDSEVDKVKFSHDGSELVTYGPSAEPQLWNAVTGHAIGKPLGSDPLNTKEVFFTLDDKLLVKLGGVMTLSEWDVRTGNVVVPEGQVGVPASGLAIMSPDGQHFALSMMNKTAIIWDIRKRQAVGDPLQTEALVTEMEFSPDCKRLLTVAQDGNARIWDVSSATEIGQPMHMYGMLVAHFSPDGTMIVTAGIAGAAQFWDSTTTLPIGQSMAHDNLVSDAVFSPRGAGLLTLSNHKVRLWQSATGLPLCDPITPNEKEPVNRAIFGPNGELLTAAGNTVHAWDLWPPHQLVPDWLPVLAEAAGGLQLSVAGTLNPTPPDNLSKLKSQLANVTGEDYWSRVGRWYFADPAKRTISAQSNIMVSDYVQQMLAIGTAEALDEAQRVAAGSPNMLAQIDAKRAELPVSK